MRKAISLDMFATDMALATAAAGCAVSHAYLDAKNHWMRWRALMRRPAWLSGCRRALAATCNWIGSGAVWSRIRFGSRIG